MSTFTHGTTSALLSDRSMNIARTLLSAGLTRTEWKVLKLVADGKSDLEIRDALELATCHQVYRHVGKIRRKLRVTTRRELRRIYKVYTVTVEGRAA